MSTLLAFNPDTAWLTRHRADLRKLAGASRHPHGGFGWLDDDGVLTPGRDIELWITCRMTHVHALGHLEGDPKSADLLDHGLRALQHTLHDDEHDGWFAAVSALGATNPAKEAYGHAFVILAAASAVAAGHPAGDHLLAHALDIVDDKFWTPQEGLVVDVWDRDWSTLDPYRGVNANMHTVEAYLAAADVTGEREWLDRAARIVHRVVHTFAAGNGNRLPEHFDSSWRAVRDYNLDTPGHPFRPYGVTIGHLFEWARLSLHVRSALGPNAPHWLLHDAQALFAQGLQDGWSDGEHPGIVYTTDFEGKPVVAERMHWVVTEAIAAAWSLHSATAERSYLDLYRRWWAHAAEHYITADGSCRHELSPRSAPSGTVWAGRPDVYHAYQAALLPELDGDMVSFAGASRAARG